MNEQIERLRKESLELESKKWAIEQAIFALQGQCSHEEKMIETNEFLYVNTRFNKRTIVKCVDCGRILEDRYWI